MLSNRAGYDSLRAGDYVALELLVKDAFFVSVLFMSVWVVTQLFLSA